MQVIILINGDKFNSIFWKKTFKP